MAGSREKACAWHAACVRTAPFAINHRSIDDLRNDRPPSSSFPDRHRPRLRRCPRHVVGDNRVACNAAAGISHDLGGPKHDGVVPDRYPPAGFANVGSLFGRNNVLAIAIDDADADGSRPPAFSGTFYNTQGRKIDIDTAPPVTWIGSLYIPSAWATPNPADPTLTRRSDLWATLSDAADAPTWYPIIGFTNGDGTGFNGGTPRYRVWDNADDVWVDLALPVRTTRGPTSASRSPGRRSSTASARRSCTPIPTPRSPR